MPHFRDEIPFTIFDTMEWIQRKLLKKICYNLDNYSDAFRSHEAQTLKIGDKPKITRNKTFIPAVILVIYELKFEINGGLKTHVSSHQLLNLILAI